MMPLPRSNSRNQMARRFWTPQIDAQDMLPGYDAWPEETVFTYQVRSQCCTR
jgi:hypothetical protein